MADWLEVFDSGFWITISASVFAFLGLSVRACLKSNCSQVNCLCFKCVRDTEHPGDLELSRTPTSVARNI